MIDEDFSGVFTSVACNDCERIESILIDDVDVLVVFSFVKLLDCEVVLVLLSLLLFESLGDVRCVSASDAGGFVSVIGGN